MTDREISLKSFTCIAMSNLRGSDSPPMPTPVHLECWEGYLEDAGFIRVKGAKQFIVNGEWRTGLTGNMGVVCWNCKVDLNYVPTLAEIWRR